MGPLGTMDTGVYKSGVVGGNMQEFYTTRYDSQYGTQKFNGGLVSSGVDFDNRYLATQDSTILHTWQTNGRYLHQVIMVCSETHVEVGTRSERMSCAPTCTLFIL